MTTVYDARGWLYSDTTDLRGNLFSKATMSADFRACNENNPDNMCSGELFKDLFTAVSYEKVERGMTTNDIHYEITDLIVLAANYHKAIDTRNSFNSTLHTVEKNIEGIVTTGMASAGPINVILSGFFESTGNGQAKAVTYDTRKSKAEVITDGKTNMKTKIDAPLLKSLFDAVVDVNGATAIKSHRKLNALLGSGNHYDRVPLADVETAFNTVFRSFLEGIIDKFIEEIMATGKVLLTKRTAGANAAETITDAEAKAAFDSLNTTDASTISNLYDLLQKAFENELFKSGRYAKTNKITLKSDEAKNLHEKIYKNWSSLRNEDKQFYQHFISPMQWNASQNDWVKMNEQDYGKIQLTEEYRFNLNTSGGHTQFFNSIPFVPSGFTRLWYTNATSGKVDVVTLSATATDRQKVLRDIYDAIYSDGGASPLSVGGAAPGLVTAIPVHNTYANAKRLQVPYFSVNVDKLVRKLLYRLSQAKIDDDIGITEGESHMNLINRETYRKDPKTGAYQVKGSSGWKNIDDASILLTGNKCFTSNATGDCRKFVFECLLDNDEKQIRQCIDGLSAQSVVEAAKKDINNMHPLIALRLLQKFGFGTQMKYDVVANRQLKKVICVNEWIKNVVAKKFTAQEVTEIKTAQHLRSYLQLVVDYVNGNPGILNKGYGGSSEEQSAMYTPTAYAKALNLEPRIEPTGTVRNMYDIRRFISNLRSGYFPSLIKAKINPVFSGIYDGSQIASPFGLNFTGVPSNVFHKPMWGGAQSGGGNFEWMIRRFNSGYTTGAKMIKSVFDTSIRSMEAKGYQLADDDKKRLTDKINKLVRDEDEALVTVAFIEEFNRLKDQFHGYGSATLTEGNLQNLVNRHSKQLYNIQNQSVSLAEILEKLEDLTSREKGSKGPYGAIRL